MGSRKLIPAAAFACLTCLTAAQAGAQQVTIQTDSPLLAEPKADATVVTQLKKGTSGQQTGKQGMFVNVKTAAGAGWVYAFNVGIAPGGAAAAGSVAGRGGPNLSGKVAITPVIGLRGLTEEDLRKAVTDQQQLKILDGYVASPQDAEAAAAQSGLSPYRIDYFR